LGFKPLVFTVSLGQLFHKKVQYFSFAGNDFQILGNLNIQDVAVKIKGVILSVRPLRREIEGFHAKRAYVAFWVDFFFCRIELIFGRLTCFDMKSIVA